MTRSERSALTTPGLFVWVTLATISIWGLAQYYGW